jgi:hypothetical protein
MVALLERGHNGRTEEHAYKDHSNQQIVHRTTPVPVKRNKELLLSRVFRLLSSTKQTQQFTFANQALPAAKTTHQDPFRNRNRGNIQPSLW